MKHKMSLLAVCAVLFLCATGCSTREQGPRPETSGVSTSTTSPPNQSVTTTTAATPSSAFTSTSTTTPPEPAVAGTELSPHPSPIVYIEDVPGGEPLDFQVELNTVVPSVTKKEWSDHVALIRSYDELAALYQEDTARYDEMYQGFTQPEPYIDFEKYNADYFKDHALIVLCIVKGDGGSDYNIDNVRLNKDQLGISLSPQSISDAAAAVMTYYRTLIAVSPDDIREAKDIVVYDTGRE